MAYLKVLEDQLAGLDARFGVLTSGDLAKANADLVKAGLKPITVPPANVAANTDAGGDRDAQALAGWRFSLRDVKAVAGAAEERD